MHFQFNENTPILPQFILQQPISSSRPFLPKFTLMSRDSLEASADLSEAWRWVWSWLAWILASFSSVLTCPSWVWRRRFWAWICSYRSLLCSSWVLVWRSWVWAWSHCVWRRVTWFWVQSSSVLVCSSWVSACWSLLWLCWSLPVSDSCVERMVEEICSETLRSWPRDCCRDSSWELRDTDRQDFNSTIFYESDVLLWWEYAVRPLDVIR